MVPWICSEVRVEGLETLDYFDNLLQRERYTEQADAITFDGEVIFLASLCLYCMLIRSLKSSYCALVILINFNIVCHKIIFSICECKALSFCSAEQFFCYSFLS